MGPTFSAMYVEPGTYVTIEDVAQPAIPQSLLYPALIGQGSKTVNVTAVITRGTGAQDLLYDLAVAQVVGVGASIRIKTLAVGGDVNTLQNDYTIGATGSPTGTNAFTFDSTTNSVDWSTPDGLAPAPPAPGDIYTVVFTKEKESTDYAPAYGTKLSDIETLFGPNRKAAVIVSGSGAIAGNVLTDGGAINFITSGVVAGHYATFTDPGTPGDYYSRVIIAVSANTLTFAAVASGAVPIAAPDYVVADISENSITLGADLAFQNGAPIVMGSQMVDETELLRDAALAALENYDPYVIVPMQGLSSTDATYLGLIRAHVIKMSSTTERRERTAILSGPAGMISGSVSTYISDVSALTQSLDSNRICYIVPTIAQRYLSVMDITSGVELSELTNLDGSYLAAAVSGLVTTALFDEGEPLTKKTLTGFDDILYSTVQMDLLRAEKNILANYGTFIIEKQGINIVIRHALTTNMDTAVSQEFQVTRIADVLAKTLRTTCDSSVIGTRDLGSSTDSTLKVVISTILDSKLGKSIQGYKNLTVSTNPIEARQKDVSFQIKPVFTINWIWIKFGVGTTL